MQLNNPTDRTREQNLRHEGVIRVSERVLKEVLQLPAAWNLLGVKHDAWAGSVEFLFAGPDLPPVMEGGIPPTLDRAVCFGDRRVA